MKKFLKKTVVIIGIFLVLFTGNAGVRAVSAPETIPSAQQPEEWQELQVHYIDVGQGDSTLLICGDQAMLIDAGNNNKGTTVQLYLQKQGIDALDYVVGTHPDADHIGGLDVIITKFDCGTIFMPDVSNDTNTYRDVLDAMKYKDYSVTVPGVGDTYTLGDATFTILAPSRNYMEMNNNSIVIRVEHGENTFLFVGDAAEESEADMLVSGLPLQAQVLKVGHHGSSSSTSKAFLDVVYPDYAVISCGRDNSYGHPTAETLTTLREAGVQVFRTDEQGSIVVTSDGQKLVFSQTPYAYMLNTNTMKFHRPGCLSIQKMAEDNKLPSNRSREEILAKGYEPCQICKP